MTSEDAATAGFQRRFLTTSGIVRAMRLIPPILVGPVVQVIDVTSSSGKRPDGGSPPSFDSSDTASATVLESYAKPTIAARLRPDPLVTVTDKEQTVGAGRDHARTAATPAGEVLGFIDRSRVRLVRSVGAFLARDERG